MKPKDQMGITSAFVYDRSYWTAMNARLSSVSEMQARVAELSSAPNSVLSSGTMAWGTYQPLVMDRSQWPGQTYDRWAETVAAARADFARLTNVERVSVSDPRVPSNRCDWLDAVITECFTKPAGGETAPGIPIRTFVRFKCETEPDPDLHDVTLAWRYDQSGRPCMVDYVMHCPASENPAAQLSKGGKAGVTAPVKTPKPMPKKAVKKVAKTVTKKPTKPAAKKTPKPVAKKILKPAAKKSKVSSKTKR